jgi:hypothetical protein
MHLQLNPGPEWFSGPDFIFDIFGMIILLVISIFSWKFYEINKKGKHLMMFVAFGVLGASFVFKIITYFMLYLTTFELQVLNVFGQLVYYMEPNNIYFTISFVIYSLLTLVGFYILYTIYEPKLPAKASLLIMYFLIIVTLFTENAYVFLHLTAMILTALITLSLWSNYKKNKLENTKGLAVSFGVLTFSRIFFILAALYSPMYVIGELVQFGGYVLLMFIFMRVLNDGKKKGTSQNY